MSEQIEVTGTATVADLVIRDDKGNELFRKPVLIGENVTFGEPYKNEAGDTVIPVTGITTPA